MLVATEDTLPRRLFFLVRLGLRVRVTRGFFQNLLFLTPTADKRAA